MFQNCLNSWPSWWSPTTLQSPSQPFAFCCPHVDTCSLHQLFTTSLFWCLVKHLRDKHMHEACHLLLSKQLVLQQSEMFLISSDMKTLPDQWTGPAIRKISLKIFRSICPGIKNLCTMSLARAMIFCFVYTHCFQLNFECPSCQKLPQVIDKGCC